MPQAIAEQWIPTTACSTGHVCSPFSQRVNSPILYHSILTKSLDFHRLAGQLITNWSNIIRKFQFHSPFTIELNLCRFQRWEGSHRPNEPKSKFYLPTTKQPRIFQLTWTQLKTTSHRLDWPLLQRISHNLPQTQNTTFTLHPSATFISPPILSVIRNQPHNKYFLQII